MHCYVRNSEEKSKRNRCKTFGSSKAHTCSFLKLDVLTGHPIMRCETYFIDVISYPVSYNLIVFHTKGQGFYFHLHHVELFLLFF